MVSDLLMLKNTQKDGNEVAPATPEASSPFPSLLSRPSVTTGPWPCVILSWIRLWLILALSLYLLRLRLKGRAGAGLHIPLGDRRCHPCLKKRALRRARRLHLRANSPGEFATQTNWPPARLPLAALSPRLDIRRGLLPVLGAALFPILHALGIQHAADDVVAHTGQVLHTTAADQHHRVLLQVVALAGNVGGDFHRIAQAHAGDFAQRGVRLLGRLGTHVG